MPPPVPDGGTGPPPVPGRLHLLLPGLARLTAPNPGVMTGPGTNTYLVGADDLSGDLAVVDPGPDDPVHRRAILDAAGGSGGRVRWVLVTHTHPDHAPGAMSLASEAGAEIVGFGPRDGFVPHVRAGDGWELAGRGFRLRALHTPGHAANHLCWLLVDRGVLLSGDHVMHGATVVIRPPDGDMAAYLTSLRRLRSLAPPLVAIAPGHGRLIGTPAAAVDAVIAHRLGREAAVARALAAAGAATLDELLPKVYAEVDPSLLAIARFSLWAHLRKLAQEGRALLVSPAGPAGPVDEMKAADAELDGQWAATPTT